MFGTIEGEISRYVNVDLTSAIQAPFQTLRWTNAANPWPCDAGVPATSNPMVGSFAGCARTANGHAAVAPRSPMNSRRFNWLKFIRSPHIDRHDDPRQRFSSSLSPGHSSSSGHDHIDRHDDYLIVAEPRPA